jgi:uncharacterized RDD family membrane protein YckC
VKRFWPFLIPGVILIGIGLVWTLQGINVLGGSVMSGSSTWATIGPMVIFVGLVLVVIAIVNRIRGRRDQG